MLTLMAACGGGSGDGGSGGAATDSSSSTGGAPSGGSGSTPSGGSSAGVGGGATGTGGTSSDTGGTQGEQDDTIGRIQVHRTLAYSGTTGANATFDRVEEEAWVALGDGVSSCTTTSYGECRVTICPTPVEPDPDPDVDPDDLPSLARWESGTLSITPDSGDFTATGLPSGTNGAYQFSASGSFAGEEIVTVSSAGGTIAAFQGTIQVPLAPLLTSHAASAEVGETVSIPVPRGADFELSWDARGTGDWLQAIVLPPDTTDDVPSVSCSFAADAGVGVVEAEVLTQLPAGTEIHFFSVGKAEVTTPEGMVELYALFELLSEDKTGYPEFVLE